MPPQPKPLFVAYYRVSTQRQGESGLGLEAQRETVTRHVQAVGGEVLAEGTDLMSGRRRDRPELVAALARAKATGATLIVAKLDRLARDARFLLELADGGVPVHLCDFPSLSIGDQIVNRMVLTILAAVAEFESRRIGQRIKEAIAAKRARGEPIRGPMEGRKAKRSWARYMARRRTAEARHDERVRRLVGRLRERRYTLAAMADWLNRKGVRTFYGKQWTLFNLWRCLQTSG
jgi:DNA invertase Pin-like site-specific DNA recombinase